MLVTHARGRSNTSTCTRTHTHTQLHTRTCTHTYIYTHDLVRAWVCIVGNTHDCADKSGGKHLSTNEKYMEIFYT